MEIRSSYWPKRSLGKSRPKNIHSFVGINISKEFGTTKISFLLHFKNSITFGIASPSSSCLPQIQQPPRMTKTRPHFTRCIEHFFPRRRKKERRKVSLSNSASFLWSHLSALFLAADERNEAILGLQKSDQHHLHHCRTFSDAKLSKTATKILFISSK